MAKEKDNHPMTTECTFCGQMFPIIKDCLRHELLTHHLHKRDKPVCHIRKSIEYFERYLNTSEKKEERTKLKEHLKEARKGEELKVIFKLFAMKTDYLELIFTRIQTCIEKLFHPPGVVKIYPFGSIANGLALRDCDIDIFLDASDLQLTPTKKRSNEIEDHQSQQRAVFSYIAKLFYGSPDFTNVCPIRHARVPIIRCRHISTGFSIDINMSFPSSRENTRFIYDLVSSDDRIHELMLFLKLWVKNWNFRGESIMTSYCLVTMIIFFLQQPRNDGSRILKSLKELQEHCQAHILQGVNYAYNLTCRENTPIIPSDVKTLDLLREFFGFYKDFKFEDVIISPFYGKAIARTDLTPDICDEYYKQLKTITHYSQGNEAKPLQIDACMCVQDAFCLNQNVAKTVLPRNKEHFVFCLKNAHQICESSKDAESGQVYEQLLYETLKTRDEPTKIEKKIKNFHLNTDDTKQANDNYKLMFTITPSKADLSKLLALSKDFKLTEEASKKWCEHYVEAIEIMMTQLYRMEMQKQSPTQQKQLKLENNSEANELNRNWAISCTVDLWTNREFLKNSQTSFIAHQLEQTEHLYNLRRQNPEFSVTLNAILKLNILPNYKGVEIQVDLPDNKPISRLSKRSHLRKFFNIFRNTLQNYSLKEALQYNKGNLINCSDNNTTDAKR